MKKTVLKKYADLLVRRGVSLKKGQCLTVFASVDQAPLVKEIVAAGYKQGAKAVSVEWSFDEIEKLHYKHQSLKTLSEVPNWKIEKLKNRVETLPARIYITSEDPDGMKGVNQAKIAKARMATYPILKPFIDQIENKEQWCIAGAASPAWAKKVFPGLKKKEAVEKLWDAIMQTSRMCDDPVAAWDEHNKNLKEKCDYLNNLHLKELHYTSSNGTNLTVGLAKESTFGFPKDRKRPEGFVPFTPNIPSEEICTSPHKFRTEGIVYATKPLVLGGKKIENFGFRFENGKVVEVLAEEGREMLESLVRTDEGACYLGECALVEYHSPISMSGYVYYTTLIDENASCHLALGRALNSGSGIEYFNESQIHIDFMIGAADTEIVGITEDGRKVQIFHNGDFAI